MGRSNGNPPAAGGAGPTEPALGVERGPDWLFLRVDGAAAHGASLVETVWRTIREHGASRVVLELDHVETVDRALADAVATVGSRVRDAGGLIRICGLSPAALSRLRSVDGAAAVPHFASRAEAVWGPRAGIRACE